MFYGHAPIHSLPSKYVAEKLLDETSIDWNSMNDFFKWGVYIKRVNQIDGGIGVRQGGVILKATEDFNGEKDESYSIAIKELITHLFEDTANQQMKEQFVSLDQYIKESVNFDEALDRVYSYSIEFKNQFTRQSVDSIVLSLDHLPCPIPSFSSCTHLNVNTAKQLLVGWFSRFSMAAPIYESAGCGVPPSYFSCKVVLPIQPKKHPKGKPVCKVFGIGEDSTLKGAQKNAALNACLKLLSLGTLVLSNGAQLQVQGQLV